MTLENAKEGFLCDILLDFTDHAWPEKCFEIHFSRTGDFEIQLKTGKEFIFHLFGYVFIEKYFNSEN